jgi:hypothetical protein
MNETLLTNADQREQINQNALLEHGQKRANQSEHSSGLFMKSRFWDSKIIVERKTKIGSSTNKPFLICDVVQAVRI